MTLAPDRAILLITDGTDDTFHSEVYTSLAARIAAHTSASVRCCSVGGLRASLELAIAGNSRNLVFVPLALGNQHPALREIAGVLQWAQARWSHITFHTSAPYADGALLASLLARQLTAVLATAPQLKRHDVTAIVLAPHGGDADANAELASAAQRLWERSAVGWTQLAFLEDSQPSLSAAVRRSQQAGDHAVVVLPVTLFADATYTRIDAEVGAIAAAVAPFELLLAPPAASVEGAAATVAVRIALASEPNYHRHEHTPILPPRYQNNSPVSAAPMGSADLKFGADGRVAWDAVWGDFCDLALAGGPPQRGTLLEPASPEAVRADPGGYAQVLEELARGLSMVTNLEVLANAAPGWIGLRCHTEAMALWLLRAILVENIAVRREGATLFLPAGPHFRLAHEIKNVITVVAKTHHYWMEHQRTKD